jgi:glycosyltransferase (TIGR04182 family)
MKVSVIIPALNEEATIAKVVKDFRKNKRVGEVVVYDGNSSDKTRENAKGAGARVLVQDGRGKGAAMREIFERIDADIYVIVDGDNTYPAESLDALLEPILKGRADMAVGSRMGRRAEKGSFNRLHKIGNRIISSTISMSFGKRLDDVLSGYRAISKRLAKGVSLNSDGFEIETELTIKSLMENFRVVEVPITYRKRPESSRSKLSSFGDGYLIFYTIISMLRDYRPFLFFFTLSVVFGFAGLILGAIVVDEWLTTGFITRLPTAILSALLVFLSVQFFTIGVILDAMKKIRTGHR